MIVAATPIVPPDGEKCWAFHVVNDGADPIESGVVEVVDYEWGDMGNAESVGVPFGEIPPGKSLEVYRETDTEVRTSLTLLIRDKSGDRRYYAEFGKLYRPPGNVVPIPILNREGKLGTVALLPGAAGTIEVDDVGVRRWLEGGRCESAHWGDLVRVEIMTTDEGPVVEDVFWVLHEANRGCVIPSGAKEAEPIVERLQSLPGFDHAEMIKAMSSSTNARFVVWRAK